MSGPGRKRVSKWDSKEDTHHDHHSSINTKLDSYYRDKEPEPFRFDLERNNGRRGSVAADEQHSGDARTRSRVSQNNDNSYYSEQDEIRQQFFRRSGSRSISRSRSRSRSPIYRSRRDTGSYDRHNTRTRVLPLPVKEFNKRSGDHNFDQSSDCGWEDKVRKPRETNYHADDFREQTMMKGVRSSDYNTDSHEDNSRREHLHDGVSDPRLRRHKSELPGDGEGEFHRSSNVPCKFFAAGFCRNGKYCRFAHHGADRKQPQDNNIYRQDNNNHNGHKWNDFERLDSGNSGMIEVSRAIKGVSESKGNRSNWIDDIEMSPDWNYRVKTSKNPAKDENGVGIVGQSSQSRDCSSNGMFSYGDKHMIEKPKAAPHQNYNSTVNIPQVQAFNQNDQNHNGLPYQNSLSAGGSQQVLAAAASAAEFPVGSNLSKPESGNVIQSSHPLMVLKPVPAQNTVTKEQIDHITNISASLAQFLANGQPIQQIKQAPQIPLHPETSMVVQPNQATTALHTQSNSMNNKQIQILGLGISAHAEGVPAVTASQVNNVDVIQELALNPKASEEKVDKKIDETNKEEEGKKAGEDTKNGENQEGDDHDDEGSDEENKKGKDTKGTRAFKFVLVENVKELLKPAWKEGKMNKDGYKNIVKKVVEKVTGTIQSGNVPQTQEKIDIYLSASKPKLTKLVQAYISKVKKN